MKPYSIIFLLIFISFSVFTTYAGFNFYTSIEGKTQLEADDFDSEAIWINDFYAISFSTRYDCSEVTIKVEGLNKRNKVVYQESMTIVNVESHKEYTVSFLIDEYTYYDIDELVYYAAGTTDGFAIMDEEVEIIAPASAYTRRDYNVTIVKHFLYIIIFEIILFINFLVLLATGKFKYKK